MDTKGQNKDTHVAKTPDSRAHFDDFVLEKGIFSNIFEKDIRRVYIYKKSERLAKAIHLVAPAFRNSPSLRDRLDQVAIGLVDAAILPPASARDALSRELLALSSVLSIARTSGMLSVMNVELIGREAHQLLQEIASYEEPRLFMDDAPSLAELAKDVASIGARESKDARLASHAAFAPVQRTAAAPRVRTMSDSASDKGQIKDKNNDRREAIKSVLKSKGPSYIKDISTVIRDVSEKTIQRELQAMVDEGEITKAGERRWTTYALA